MVVVSRGFGVAVSIEIKRGELEIFGIPDDGSGNVAGSR